MLFFHGPVFANAKDIGIKPEQTINKCEEQMIKAFGKIDEFYFESYIKNWTQTVGNSGVSKSKALPLIQTHYYCDTHYICAAIKQKNTEISLRSTDSDLFLNCPESFERSRKSIEKKWEVDFNACQQGQTQNSFSHIWQACEDFAEVKNNGFTPKVSSHFYEYLGRENQGMLAEKMLGINKRMKGLIEKTQVFVVNFTKVLDDISCTI